MNRSTTLSASDAVANVEVYLAAQYAKRKVAEKPADGVIGMWIRIVRIAIKKVNVRNVRKWWRCLD